MIGRAKKPLWIIIIAVLVVTIFLSLFISTVNRKQTLRKKRYANNLLILVTL